MFFASTFLGRRREMRLIDGSRMPPWVFRSMAFALGVQDYYYGLHQGSIPDLAAAIFFIREAEKRGARVRPDFPGEALVVREMMATGIYTVGECGCLDRVGLWVWFVDDGKPLPVSDLKRVITFGADPGISCWSQFETAMTRAACEIFVHGAVYPISMANLCFFLEQVKAA